MEINLLQLQYDILASSEGISDILSKVLLAFEIDKDVSAKFNRKWFRMDISVGENEYNISLQGRGVDIEKYKTEILDIVKKEVEEYK